MTQTGRYHGGLAFSGDQGRGLDKFCRIVTATLEDYGHPVERQSLPSPSAARITSSRYTVVLKSEPGNGLSDTQNRSLQLDRASGLNDASNIDLGARSRLTLSLRPVDAASDDVDHAQLLLVVIMYRMIEAYGADIVEWLDPETKLPVSRFMSVFHRVSPRRVRGRQQILEADAPRFAPVDDTERSITRRYAAISGQKPAFKNEGIVELTEEEALALAFRTEPRPDEVSSEEVQAEAENDIRRLASWGMTGVVAFLSAPVAVSLAAVNLARGEDFRLNTQVLTYTGFLTVLHSSGAMAGVIRMLPM